MTLNKCLLLRFVHLSKTVNTLITGEHANVPDHIQAFHVHAGAGYLFGGGVGVCLLDI